MVTGRGAANSVVSGGRDGREAGGAHVEPFHLAGKEKPRRRQDAWGGESRGVTGGLTGGDTAWVASAARVGSGKCSSPDVHRPPAGRRQSQPALALRLLLGGRRARPA